MEISNEKLIRMFRYLYLTRRFDEAATELNRERRIIGSVHAGVGEEGASVGITMALSKGDYISPSYRDLGAVLAGGLETQKVMAMLYAKEGSHTGGRTRLMHLGDLDKHVLPPNPILGASSAICQSYIFADKVSDTCSCYPVRPLAWEEVFIPVIFQSFPSFSQISFYQFHNI